MLNDEQQKAWGKYLDYEKNCLNLNLKIDVLNEFIGTLKKTPMAQYSDWVESLLHSYEPELNYIRFPLKTEIIIPVLCYGLQDNKPNYARWLSRLWYCSYTCPHCFTLEAKNDGRIHLLLTALESNPEDKLAEAYLLEAIEEDLTSSLWGHVPSSIIHVTSSNGRDEIKMIQQLLDRLSRFQKSKFLEPDTLKLLELYRALNYLVIDFFQVKMENESFEFYIPRSLLEMMSLMADGKLSLLDLEKAIRKLNYAPHKITKTTIAAIRQLLKKGYIEIYDTKSTAAQIPISKLSENPNFEVQLTTMGMMVVNRARSLGIFQCEEFLFCAHKLKRFSWLFEQE